MSDDISRYCMRCNAKAHGQYKGGAHETNEHDEWLERQRRRASEMLADPEADQP